jgi:WD40 repeat protein
MQPGGRQSDELPLALLLAIEAYEVHDTVEARGALLNVLSAQPALLAQHRYHRQSNEVRNVEGIAFHPNGRWVASGGADRKVRIFDTTTNTTSKVFAPGFYVNALAFHPEGRELVVSGINDDGALIAQPFPQGKPRILQNPTGSDPTRLTFSPGGEWLVATAQDPRVLLWDWAHKAVSPKVIHDLRVAGSDDVRAMGATFSPDGQALFVPTNTGRVRMISVPEGAQIRELAHDEQRGPVFAVAVNGSNNRIATSGGNQEIKFWNLADGCPVAVNLSGLPHDISYALAFSPDGRKLAVAGEERIIRVWDLPTGLLLAQFNYHQRIATQLSFSPDGKRLASGGQDGLVAVWDVDDFQRLSTPLNAYEEMGLGGVAISADGRFIAASDGARLTLWTRSSEHDRASWVIAGPPVTTAQALLSHLAFSPDGKRLVAAGEDQMVIRDIATSYDRVVDLGPERRAVTAIGFQDNDTVLLIRRSGYWQTRNLSTGAPVREGIFTTFTNVTVAAISGDGSLAWATDQDLRYCSHSCFGPQPPGSQSIATSTSFDRVAFNSDGRYIAWTRSDNATVSWLSTKSTEDPVRIVVAGTAPILGLAFSDDANLLATGDSQGAIRLWDLNTSRQIGSSLANRSGRPGIVNVLRDLSFFPDGHQLLSWGQRAGTVIWDTDRASWLAQAKSLVDRNLTASEWHQFFGASTPYRRILTTLPPGDQAAELEMARQGGTSAR